MHLLPIAFILKIYRFDHREVLEEELIPRSEHSGSEEHWFRVDRYDKITKMPPWNWVVLEVSRRDWRRLCSLFGMDREVAAPNRGQCRSWSLIFRGERRVDRGWWFRRRRCPHSWRRRKLSWFSRSASWAHVQALDARDKLAECGLPACSPVWLCWGWGRSLLVCSRLSAESLMTRE